MMSKHDFVYVSSLKLHVAKQTSLHNKNWYNSHKELQKQGNRMLTIPEFIKFLNHLKSSNNLEYQEIYKNIIGVRSPWRAEWLDADFKMKNNQLYINYNYISYSKGKLVSQNSEVLSEATLMQDETSGISLEGWLSDKGHTKQGLPTKETEKGNLYYRHPRSDNNSVARFGSSSNRTGLGCGRYPSSRVSSLGVRAVRHE
ncbi:hypothetical protein CMI40_01240 [Candidatus Pacearchaeota archaeon]|nr:hypothetical protein [Candidatus Pacearchaeota archaeon]